MLCVYVVCICCVYLLCGYVMWIYVVFVYKDKDECSTVNCHQCILMLVISNISGCIFNLMYHDPFSRDMDI